ncbi:DUF1810 domain-containing protein [Pedobacter sp. GSP4]|uniref:DUF1810 domain-containing protein n=1 Tax=Pedobacter sp. GSP4 TaxID=3453716 RepID=UPI003EEA44D8
MENKDDDKYSLTSNGDEELEKFVVAQEHSYSTALSEISNGKKLSHWMWYIFPQIQGLGFSDTAKHYAIIDLKQASAYLKHPVLGRRLIEISDRLLIHQSLGAHEIFGSTDELKLRSSMSLFASLRNAPTVFQKVLDQFFEGKKDIATLRVLGM